MVGSDNSVYMHMYTEQSYNYNVCGSLTHPLPYLGPPWMPFLIKELQVNILAPVVCVRACMCCVCACMCVCVCVCVYERERVCVCVAEIIVVVLCNGIILAVSCICMHSQCTLTPLAG